MATTLMSVTPTNTSAPPTPRTPDSEPMDYTNCIHINNMNDSADLRTNVTEARHKHDDNGGAGDDDESTPILLNIFLIRKKRYRVFYNAGKLVWERYQSKKGKNKLVTCSFPFSISITSCGRRWRCHLSHINTHFMRLPCVSRAVPIFAFPFIHSNDSFVV